MKPQWQARRVTALIAEDEPMLRAQLRTRLAAGVAGARDRRRGGKRRAGAGAGGRARARHRVPRHPHAGQGRSRRRGCNRRRLSRRLRHRLRRVRGQRLRAGRGRLCAEAGHRRARRQAGRPAQAAARVAAGRSVGDSAASGRTREQRLAALDQGVAGGDDAADSGRRNLLFPRRGQVHAASSPPTATR